jgi:hypothetical protein
MRSTQSIGTFDKPRSPKPSASSASAAAHNNILRIKPAVLRVVAGDPKSAAVQGVDRSADRSGPHHHHGGGLLPVPPHHGPTQGRENMMRRAEQRR